MADKDNLKGNSDKDKYDDGYPSSNFKHFNYFFGSGKSAGQLDLAEIIADCQGREYSVEKRKLTTLLKYASGMSPDSQNYPQVVHVAHRIMSSLNSLAERLYGGQNTSSEAKKERRQIKTLANLVDIAQNFPQNYTQIFGLYTELEEAIEKEDYERAAILRDNILGFMKINE